MARKNDPYLPLYVMDWLTNMKLKECSPEAHGLMISFMCLAHKVDDYGKLLLKEKHKICRGKSDGKLEDFAEGFADYFSKILPWSKQQILPALIELITEEVLFIEGDFLVCKRMVKDADISEKRSKSGKEGADVTNGKDVNPKKPSKKEKDFAAAKHSANSEIEIDNETETEIVQDKFSIISIEGGMGGDYRQDFEWQATVYNRFLESYGAFGRAPKRGAIEQALLEAIHNLKHLKPEANAQECADFLIAQADVNCKADQANGQTKRLNPETWLNNRVYQTNINLIKQPTKLSPSQRMDAALDKFAAKILGGQNDK